MQNRARLQYYLAYCGLLCVNFPPLLDYCNNVCGDDKTVDVAFYINKTI